MRQIRRSIELKIWKLGQDGVRSSRAGCETIAKSNILIISTSRNYRNFQRNCRLELEKLCLNTIIISNSIQLLSLLYIYTYLDRNLEACSCPSAWCTSKFWNCVACIPDAGLYVMHYLFLHITTCYRSLYLGWWDFELLHLLWVRDVNLHHSPSLQKYIKFLGQSIRYIWRYLYKAQLWHDIAAKSANLL